VMCCRALEGSCQEGLRPGDRSCKKIHIDWTRPRREKSRSFAD
jgi:hypothetical protein